MIPANPLLAVYVLGVYAFAFLLLFALVARPMVFGVMLDEAERAGMRRGVVIFVLLVLHTVGWPVTVIVCLATNGRD